MKRHFPAWHRAAVFATSPCLRAVLAGVGLLIGSPAWPHEEGLHSERETEARSESHGPREAHEIRDPMARDGSGKDSSDDGRSESGRGSESEEREGGDRNASVDPANRPGAERINIERDAAGRERRPGEVLMVGRPEAVAEVRAAGYGVIAERPLAAFGETVARLRVRLGESVEQAVPRIQALAPDASVAPNHVYRLSQDGPSSAIGRPVATIANASAALVGVIDAGADPAWGTLTRAIVRTQGFAAGGYAPRTHGTVVAEIASAGGASLAVADVFGTDEENRLVAPGEAIASAIDWLVAGSVRVVNISIEGPENQVLAHVIRRAIARDVVIVAAAGNGGPAAPPAYPAAYPGVIAVTAVDEQGQVYRRANRGDYIAFAARGVHIESRYGATAPQTLSGTSFAAPVVAAAIASKMGGSRHVNAQEALAVLRSEARDLGAPGWDPIYGWGQIGTPSSSQSPHPP